MNKGYYAVIPANVRYDKDLSNKTKLVYAEFTALADKERKIKIDAREVSKNINISYSNVIKAIVELKEENIICVENENSEDYFEISLI